MHGTRTYLLDARGVETNARQGSGGHGIGVETHGVSSVRAVAVSEEQVLGPRVERRRYLTKNTHKEKQKLRVRFGN